MDVGPARRTSLPTGFSEWGLGHVSHTWKGSLCATTLSHSHKVKRLQSSFVRTPAGQAPKIMFVLPSIAQAHRTKLFSKADLKPYSLAKEWRRQACALQVLSSDSGDLGSFQGSHRELGRLRAEISEKRTESSWICKGSMHSP